jgi:hypothetical protein
MVMMMTMMMIDGDDDDNDDNVMRIHNIRDCEQPLVI